MGVSLFQQVLLHKLDSCIELVIHVFLFVESVSFIFSQQPPNRDSVLPDDRNHLLRFAGRNPGIVLSRNYKQGFGDVLGFVVRCNLFQKFAHLGISFISIFHTPQILAVA